MLMKGAAIALFIGCYFPDKIFNVAVTADIATYYFPFPV